MKSRLIRVFLVVVPAGIYAALGLLILPRIALEPSPAVLNRIWSAPTAALVWTQSLIFFGALFVAVPAALVIALFSSGARIRIAFLGSAVATALFAAALLADLYWATDPVAIVTAVISAAAIFCSLPLVTLAFSKFPTLSSMRGRA